MEGKQAETGIGTPTLGKSENSLGLTPEGARPDDDPNARTSLDTSPPSVSDVPKQPGFLSKTWSGIRKILTPVTTKPEIPAEEVKRIEKLPPKSDPSLEAEEKPEESQQS